MKYIEVEKKYALPDPEALKAKLVDRGAKASDPTNQVDSYYNAPHRDFTEPEAISEWLRVRTGNDGNASINYKLWPAGRPHGDEFESPVGDVEAIRRMLEALGFPPLVTVNKTREAWTLDDVEIAFDHVEGAGTFVEFEYKAEAGVQTPEEALAYLDQFIAELDIELGEQINRALQPLPPPPALRRQGPKCVVPPPRARENKPSQGRQDAAVSQCLPSLTQVLN